MGVVTLETAMQPCPGHAQSQVGAGNEENQETGETHPCP